MPIVAYDVDFKKKLRRFSSRKDAGDEPVMPSIGLDTNFRGCSSRLCRPNFRDCSARLCRPMCGSGSALPEALFFFWGYAPAGDGGVAPKQKSAAAGRAEPLPHIGRHSRGKNTIQNLCRDQWMPSPANLRLRRENRETFS